MDSIFDIKTFGSETMFTDKARRAMRGMRGMGPDGKQLYEMSIPSINTRVMFVRNYVRNSDNYWNKDKVSRFFLCRGY